MNDELRHILNHFNPDEPYVWRLHISDEAFTTLENYITEHGEQMNSRLTEDGARLVIIYLAEWYKRIYKGGEAGQTCAADGFDLKKVWEASGINTDRYVYKTELGTRLWKYSIYVLGGLAVRHELNRHDNGRFLKALCRMFHGEDYTLENLDDASRAMAFRQSITQEHSLYEYLKEILDGENEQPKDKETLALIEAIKTANDEVLRRKFTLEWMVVNQPASSVMTRMLRVWLKPEQVGGGLHQYLRYDRLYLWGVPHPETMRNLFFGLQWRKDDTVVVPLDKKHPLFVYVNTTNGFVSWGAEERFATEKDIPVCPFTHIDIVAYDDKGNEWVAQTEEAKTWMQLWRTNDGYDRWSSKQQSQHQTAVVFTDEWQADTPVDIKKPFKNKLTSASKPWNWCYIQSDITLTNGHDEPITLYNRIGYDQVFTALHRDTICYRDGGMVTAWEEDDEMGLTEELYPLIFSKEDMHVRHFRTKDAIAEAEVETEEVCKEVQFKHGDSYEPWTEDHTPDYGLVKLRVTEKGVEYKMTVLYLNGPIQRDCDNNTILYYDLQGNKQVWQDHIERDKKPLKPTVPLKIGNYEIEVYRPTSLKELYLDGEVWQYIENGEEFTLPWIFKDRVAIADFSKDGYRQYLPAGMSSPFASFDGKTDNQTLLHLKENTKWKATEFDADAPKWLNISLSKKSEMPMEELPLLKTSIYKDEEPQPFTYAEDYKKQKGEVIFLDASHPDEKLTFFYIEPGRPDPFGGKKVKNIERKCFEMAVRYQTYFSGFHPLRLMAQHKETNQKLIVQLNEKYGNDWPDNYRSELLRLADEFQLDVEKLDINL